jgi:hypothetical protein
LRCRSLLQTTTKTTTHQHQHLQQLLQQTILFDAANVVVAVTLAAFFSSRSAWKLCDGCYATAKHPASQVVTTTTTLST